MPVQIIDGDLFQTHAKYICHQVNCQARMGSGVAKQVRAKYPEVYNAYVGFCNEERNVFGRTQFAQANDGKVIVNMFAQSNYGYDGKLYTDYTAFQSCLKRIKLTVPAGETIAMPFKIGCGLGGGDWNVIFGLIQKELSDKYTVELWRKEVVCWQIRKEQKMKSCSGFENTSLQTAMTAVLSSAFPVAKTAAWLQRFALKLLA